MQIFISYKRKDETFARQIHKNLTDWGYNPWLDVIDIQAGVDWDTAIHHGLRESSIVLGLLTPESLASNNVLDEWGYALSTDKRLLLLWLRDIEEINVPPRYIRLHRIDMRTSEERGLQHLQSALASEAKIIPEDIGQGGGMREDEPPAKIAKSAKPEVNLSDSAIMRRMTNRQRMLQKVKVFWVDGVLEQSVHGVALIELGIEQDSEKVDNPWETVLKHQTYGDYQLPSSANIADIYYELGNEMLILGDPGSGKTTTLLKLARDMIERAEQDEMQAIPVVFNLSSWADDRKPLAQWLVDELNTKYQVPRPTAKEWVEGDELLLLLDGLDEVDKRYRDMCVVAINDFRVERGFTPIVVCSRIRDYEALSNRLRLNGAIVLQPLNEEQIEHYLASLGDQMSGVRDAMQTDESLRNLAESPLMLSIMTLAFFGLNEDDLPALDTVDAQRERLFETYTQRMFERRPAEKHSQPEILHYLQWLAGRMVERKQSVFYIENLQPDWIANERSRTLYRFLGRISFGMTSALIVSVIVFLATFGFAISQTDTTSSTATDIIEQYQSVSLVVSNTTTTPVEIISLIAFGVILIAMSGGSILTVTSMLDHAFETMPSTIRPIITLIRRFIILTLIGAGIGLVYSLIGTILFIIDGLIQQDFSNFIELMVNLNASGLGIGALIGSLSALIAYTVKIFAPQEEDSAEIEEIALSPSSPQLGSNPIRKSRRIDYLLRFAVIIGGGLLISALACLVLQGWSAYIFFPWLDTVFIQSLILASIPTTLISIIIAYAGKRHQATMPHVILMTGITTYLVAWLIAFSIVNSSLYIDMTATGIGTFVGQMLGLTFALGIPAAAIGVMLSLIRERIEISEALRWSWSWRWSATALAVCVIIAGFTFYQPFYDWLRFDPDKQSEAETRLDERVRLDIANQTQLDIAYDELQAILGAINESEVEAESQYIYYYDFIPSEIDTSCELHSSARALNEFDSFPNMSWFGTTRLDSSRVYYRDVSDELTADLHQIYQNITACEYYMYTHQPDNRDDARNIKSMIETNILLSVSVAVALSLSAIIGGGVVGGLRRTEIIDIRNKPNSGIRQSLITAVRVMLILASVGLIVGAIIGILLVQISKIEGLEYTAVAYIVGWRGWIVPLSVAIGICTGLIIGLLVGGGDTVVKHAVLRAFLMRTRSIPLNYARMLNMASERILLRKVGGGYIFIHRYLLEYFASQEAINRKRKESSE